MNLSRLWSTQEIEELKKLYLENLPIKLIATRLGRSITSTNKALSRFSIRPSKNIKNSLPLSKINQPPSITLESTFKKFFKRTQEIWVSFGEVVNYLQSFGFRVEPPSPYFPKTNYPTWRLNNKFVSPHWLLIQANKLRIENKKPIYLVSDISWN